MLPNPAEPLMLVSKDSRASDSPIELIARGSQILSQRNDGKLSTQDKLKKLILFSLTFMIVELVGGYISNSIAVISDALHMFTDFLGYMVQFGSAYLSSSLSDVYVFSLLIVVLLFKPSGILGKATVEKV